MFFYDPSWWLLLFLSYLTGHRISARFTEINPVDTRSRYYTNSVDGTWYAPGNAEKPCEVVGVLTGFCSADLSERVAG